MWRLSLLFSCGLSWVISAHHGQQEPLDDKPYSVIGITCNSSYIRDRLLEEFRYAGIMEVNGKKIEDFVEMRATP